MALDLNSALRAIAKQNPVHICRAGRVKLACKRQACISAKCIPGRHLQKKAHLRCRCAFFNEIRLRRVKFGSAKWNSSAVKYLLRKCDGRISFHIERSEIFHNSRSELFHIRRQPNISLLSPSSLEKHRKLCYNKTRKAVGYGSCSIWIRFWLC